MLIETLTTAQLLFAAAILFTAYLVRGISGFGSALVAVPPLALILPLQIVVPMVVLLDNLCSLAHSIRNLHHIQWRELLPLLPFTLIGIVTALFLLKSLDQALLKNILAVFIIGYAIYTLLPLPEPKGPRLWAVPMGLLAGLVGTMFGTGGPFTVVYLRLRQLNKVAFRGTVAMIFLLDGGARLVGFTLSGFYTLDTLYLIAASLPLIATGLYIGGHIHTNLTPQTFVRIISAILLISGISLLIK
ncbi:hypothetical protein BOW53_00275 [Solemya pervernicosa gill symbiont]|uniref:Probable membrane transporter protein n=2 Tax=Gammaproteobacteria incertae sedis TaxID=118884 RepID=A0A1T2LBI7_9GAMM|nr:sulfite exporter TauE/SafE family protein [Candidatus Reidiella endopervernicosa]OOZ42316.1 hypothetical protein BOW53_00275 [Solemya pervernicosa gill symbiont]QKQ25711.1 sulfite exporter TauE/SafE family protein [Candidatus Reidiella endopervernicosa]